MNKEQYPMVCARRLAFDSMVWQTPPLAIAAQAFLLATAFDPDAKSTISFVLAIFSAVVGLASIQLMTKHRAHEIADAELLRRFEAANRSDGYSVVHGRSRAAEVRHGFMSRLSSFQIWIAVLSGFVGLAIYAVADALGVL